MWQKNSEERERNSKINSSSYMNSDSFTYFACWFRIGFFSLFQVFTWWGQVKSYVVSAKRNTKGKNGGRLGREREMLPPFSRPIFFPVNFSPAPHHLNIRNRLRFLPLNKHRLLNLKLESRGGGIKDSETFRRTGFSASLGWSNEFVVMRSLVRYKALTKSHIISWRSRMRVEKRRNCLRAPLHGTPPWLARTQCVPGLFLVLQIITRARDVAFADWFMGL